MSTSLHELLDDLRAGALDERDKGDKFERLIQAFLLNDPEWAQRFSDVWLWSEWPDRQGRPDTGIDIVASNRDDDRFTAIQCKFYAAGRTVAKGDIDSFISASANERFNRRYIFDTSSGWSGNAESTLEGVAQRIDVATLEDAAIDWDQYSWHTPSVVVPTGKKTPLPHQREALADVKIGLECYDRGKLVMACGTGKTFTSLRIAEERVGAGGSVLFLVPSIQLLSQTLREWMANAETQIRPFAVCSDVRVGRSRGEDDGDLSAVDLAEPATTDAATLLERMASGFRADEQMTVVFSTYQSIDVITEAQRAGLGAFDLVICDEAHRTTGVTLAGAEQSAFVRVHDETALKATKRLYMTATPRVFADDARRAAVDNDAVIADMGDEHTYGPEIHRLGFADAVERNLLTDYKVLVLAVDEKYVADNFQQVMANAGELPLDDAAKLLGCWNGLSKNFGPAPEPSPGAAGAASDDASADDVDARVTDAPMRTAVAFAQSIKASRAATEAFPAIVNQALSDLPDGHSRLRVQAQHVDGTMRISERNTKLDWLKADTGAGVCRILTNARCLSEGVDVPALDAVIFLTPRSSQVDVVQSVGRVMRKAPGKELGYIILPVVVPSGATPEEALADNERFKVVWQVLQALRSHDDRFHVLVNQIELNKTRPDRLQIIPVTAPTDVDQDGSSAPAAATGAAEQQLLMQFPGDAFRDAMYAKIVKKVGERRYWETWAQDVAAIAERHTLRITALLDDPDVPVQEEFDVFLDGLRGNLNESISRADAVDMLAQHLITRPVFEALFEGYSFGEHNPVSQVMQGMLDRLDRYDLHAENESLERFYASVQSRAAGVDSAEGKQRIIAELYEKFFKTAFPKTAAAFGIVYTPIEVVDFILRSVEHILNTEFGASVSDEGVHILDPFTGTGTFVVRLLESGLIAPHDLARKYASEVHANEILLLAYYIAAINIEATYHSLLAERSQDSPYEPFEGIVLADTFQMTEEGDILDASVFPANSERSSHQASLDIRVIVGNPPYSVGQSSANDNNANTKYPTLDGNIERTYVAHSTATLKNSLYDSYIRALRWASDRLNDSGVIGFITNNGFLESNTADGIRKSLVDEFTSLYIVNLRGNQRSPDWRAEGGKIFGAGSQAGVAITFLIKGKQTQESARVRYFDIGSFLTREQKLHMLTDMHMEAIEWIDVTPNSSGDWLSHRSESFSEYMPLSGADDAVFKVTSAGLNTSRDAWNYNFSKPQLSVNIENTLNYYNEQSERASRGEDILREPTRISWDRVPLRDALRGRRYKFAPSTIMQAQYRPFTRMWVYSDRRWNNTVYRLPSIFPSENIDNVSIDVTAPASHYPFSVLATSLFYDRHLLDTGQGFPRWTWAPVALQAGEPGQDMLDIEHGSQAPNGFRRIDNITDACLQKFRGRYGTAIDGDDIFHYIYGLLHSTDYRATFAADLKKSLPRVPFVASADDFTLFAEAGRHLIELHTGYETGTSHELTISGDETLGLTLEEQYDLLRVEKMRFGGKGRAKDRSTIVYNRHVTVSGIPSQAHDYMLGSRSAVEWIIERYQVRTDKPSGIVNDPNSWSRQEGNPRFILELLARVVSLSLKTQQIVASLPSLTVADSSA